MIACFSDPAGQNYEVILCLQHLEYHGLVCCHFTCSAQSSSESCQKKNTIGHRIITCYLIPQAKKQANQIGTEQRPHGQPRGGAWHRLYLCEIKNTYTYVVTSKYPMDTWYSISSLVLSIIKKRLLRVCTMMPGSSGLPSMVWVLPLPAYTPPQ